MSEPYILKIDKRRFYSSLLNLWTVPERIMFPQKEGGGEDGESDQVREQTAGNVRGL
jgi:hypothetical protein